MALIGDHKKVEQALDRLDRRMVEREELIRSFEYGGADPRVLEEAKERLAEDKRELERIEDIRDSVKEGIYKVESILYNFEKTILNLSTGALALTVTFSKTLLGENPLNVEFLALSWIAFTGAIVCLLISFVFHAAEIVYDYRVMKAISNRLPGTGFFLFSLGVIMFLGFALVNLPM